MADNWSSTQVRLRKWCESQLSSDVTVMQVNGKTEWLVVLQSKVDGQPFPTPIAAIAATANQAIEMALDCAEKQIALPAVLG